MTKQSPIYQLEKPWVNNQNQVWIASTIELSRNLENFHFPTKLEDTRKQQLLNLIKQELFKLDLLPNPSLFRGDELDLEQKGFLSEHFLSHENFQTAQKGEGFILDASGHFLLTINVSNHLRLKMIDCSGQLERGWNHLVKIETLLGKSLKYAFNPRFGFLTSDPAISGTGFVLTLYLQPSALIHTKKLSKVLEHLQSDGLAFSSLLPSDHDYAGDVLVVKNRFTLGLTEENIISTLRLFITKFLVEEHRERTLLREAPNHEMMDQVGRAFGILTHSYQADEFESLGAVALVKLGVDLGWVKGVTTDELNHLFFLLRQSHLVSHLDSTVKREEIGHKRAEMIHKVIKPARLIEAFD